MSLCQARPFLNLDSTPCLRGPSLRRAPALAAVGTSSSPSSPFSSSALLLAVLAFLLLLFCLYCSLCRARAHDPTLPLDAPFASSLRRFSFRDLRSATASFDPSHSLGRGASAVVFLGILPHGKFVAVKLLDHPSSSSPSSSPPQTSFDREFHNELHVLAALPPSPFVVSFLGYCLDSPHHCLLVYEYMPNGSLQDDLFSSSDHHLVLSWDRWFGIVLDVAQALAFLSWDHRLGSGLGARLARQATQTGTMRGRTRRRTASILGIRARWKDWTVGRTPFSGNRGLTPPSGSQRRNRRRPSTVEIRRTGR